MSQMTMEQIEDVRTVEGLNGRPTIDLLAIAQRNKLPEVLVVLARHDNSVVRAAVAGNPHITHEIADVLRSDAEEAVRTALSHNPTISADAVADGIGKVRADIEENT